MKHFYILMVIIMVLYASLITGNSAMAVGMSLLSVTFRNSGGQTVSTPNFTVATTTIIFKPDGNVNTNDGININFATGFTISLIANNDVTVSQANSGVNITKGTIAIAGQNLRIPITTEGDTPSGLITITIANSHVKTPVSSGSFNIVVTTYDLGDDNAFGGSGGNADIQEDTGKAAVVISTNQVIISATVDPTLTLTLSSTSCALGTFSVSNIQTCNYDATVSTNGAGGYTAYIKDDGNLRNATNDIDDTTGGTIAEGTEEYGISTTKASQTITRINDADSSGTYTSADCTTMDGGTTDANAAALTTSDQSFASATAPINSDVTTLCHTASVTGTTPAGVYASIVTITVVGNF